MTVKRATLNSPAVKGSTKAYVTAFFPCTKAQYNFLEQFNLGKYEQIAFKHILACTINQLGTAWNEDTASLSVPVPVSVWRSKLGGTKTWKSLKQKNLLSRVSGYDKVSGKCREFTVPLPFILQFFEVGIEQAPFYRVNLFTGDRTSRKTCNGNGRKKKGDSQILGRFNMLALDLIGKEACPINLNEMKETLRCISRAFDIEGSERNKKRLIHASYAYFQVFTAASIAAKRKENKGFCSYFPSYSILSTGRIQEHGVGVQGCCRQLKKAAFSNMPNIYNYDLRSSQAWALMRIVGAINQRVAWQFKRNSQVVRKEFDVWWLRQYLNFPSCTDRFSDQCGVGRDVWKRCFYAIIMGAEWKGAITDILKSSPSVRSSDVESILGKLKKALQELECMVESLAAYINKIMAGSAFCLSSRPPKRNPSKKSKAKKSKYEKLLDLEFGDIGHSNVLTWRRCGDNGYMINASGAVMELLFLKGRWVLKDNHNQRISIKRHVIAHLLQGIEAEYIAIITVLGPYSGYRVVSNQHDGVVTEGEIPKKALKAAIKRSTLANSAKLDIKPFL